MVFDFSKEKRNFPLLQIDNIEVERVNSAEILGVMIQNNMNWWEHVTKIVKKAGKRLYMLRLLKRANANTKALSTVYITVIRPVLEYACQVWHFNIPEYLSDDIERVQKRALRIILPELCYADAREFINIPLLGIASLSFAQQLTNSQPRYKITSLIKVTGHVDIRYAIYTISTAVHATQPQIS